MPPKKSTTPFSGLTFCVSGDFNRSQNELKELIIKNGGHIAATPNKTCSYLVADSIGSAKTLKAQKDGLSIVTEDWVDASIKAGKAVQDAKYFLSGSSGKPASSKAKGKGKGKAKEEEEDDAEEEEDEEVPAKKSKSTKKATGKAAAGKTVKAAAAASSKKKKKGKKDEGDDEAMDDEDSKPVAKVKGKRKAKAEEEEEEEEAEEEEVPTKKSKTNTGAKKATAGKGVKAAAASSKKKKKGKKQEEEDELMAEEEEEDDSGSGAVAPSPAPAAAASPKPSSSSGGRKPDREVPGRDSYTIVDDYAVLLNQTNITGGRNNNKFYVIQLLRNPSGFHFVWTRWGRVGEPGQNKLDPCGDLATAIKGFESKFKDKTKNSWQGRSNFVKHDNKYELVEMEESGDGDADGDAPLGRLSKSQIEKGQALLATLRTVLETGKGGNVGELSARYYTLIPTVVGRQAAPAISSLLALQEKEELLKFMLRMGFDEVDQDDAGLSPIDGIIDLPLPKSLTEAALGITTSYDIKSADERGQDLAKNQAGKPQKKMEPHLYASIMLYTSNAIYQQLNQALREEKRHKIKAYFRYLRLFLEALGTLPGQNTTLWRGISVDLSAQYAVGSTMTWWGVSSCTSDENVARNFMRSCGGKTTLLTIKAKTACDISGVTFFPHEKESLLAPGTQVKVLSNKINGSVTEITVEEVGQAFARC